MCYWYLVGNSQGYWQNIFQCTGKSSTTKNYLGKNVNSAEFQNPCCLLTEFKGMKSQRGVWELWLKEVQLIFYGCILDITPRTSVFQTVLNKVTLQDQTHGFIPMSNSTLILNYTAPLVA
jgi:hypothetical protein